MSEPAQPPPNSAALAEHPYLVIPANFQDEPWAQCVAWLVERQVATEWRAEAAERQIELLWQRVRLLEVDWQAVRVSTSAAQVPVYPLTPLEPYTTEGKG